MSLVTVTRSYTRPTSTTSWYVLTKSVSSHWNNYAKSGSLISRTESLSKDGLTLTVVTIWKDLAAYETWLTDPIAIEFLTIRTAYYTSQGIIESTPIVTAMVQL